MVTAGIQVIIDQSHALFGGKRGTVQWIDRRPPHDEYVVIIENTSTSYEFTAEEILIP